MYIARSKLSLEALLEAARRGKIPSAESVELEALFVQPEAHVEVWDQIKEPLPNASQFVYSEYAGVEPEAIHEGRRYRRSFRRAHEAPTTVTFLSNVYRMQPLSVVLQGKRIGQTDGPESALFRMFVCDRENLLRLPAYVPEVLDHREEFDAYAPDYSG